MLGFVRVPAKIKVRFRLVRSWIYSHLYKTCYSVMRYLVAGCRKVEAYERVSCGYPGISKKDCRKDCHCCFDDDAYKSKTQCFFRGTTVHSVSFVYFSVGITTIVLLRNYLCTVKVVILKYFIWRQ